MKNYGLQFDKYEDNHYVLGGGLIGSSDINPSGQWDAFLPKVEMQARNNFDSMNCTCYGTLHSVSILNRFLYAENTDFSERYTGILSGTTQTGNSPHKVAETIRSYGIINESDLPFEKFIYSWFDYYSPNPMTQEYLSKGQNWLKMNEFKHEWVFPPEGKLSAKETESLIKAALKRSPISLSVSAWTMGDDDEIYVQKHSENHWVTCYGYDDNKRAWKIFDSYDRFSNGIFTKLYSMDSKITMAKMYWDIRRDPNAKYNSFWDFFYQLIKNFMPATATPATLKVCAFAKSIQDHEGYYAGSRSFRNNNPGNLKYCGQLLATGQDDKGFAKFATFQDGWKTLTNMITNAASGKSKVYSPNDTIQDFFNKFAPSFENDSVRYAQVVATAIGADVTMQIKNLII